VSHPLKIHTDPSSEDSDFVEPPHRWGPQQKHCNIPWQSVGSTAVQADQEVPSKGPDKVV
jgi:hypothetical protein